MDYQMINKSNYEGKILCKSYKTAILFYNKKQMKTFYPNKNFRVVGEINNKTGIQCSTVDNLNGKPLPVYKEKTHNKLTESVVGYTAIDDHIYLAVVKNVLMKRIVIISISIAIIALLSVYFLIF